LDENAIIKKNIMGMSVKNEGNEGLWRCWIVKKRIINGIWERDYVDEK